MRIKDWVNSFHIWGESADTVDLSFGEWEDVATQVKREDGERLVKISGNMAMALWWLLDHVDVQTRHQFYEKIRDVDPVTGTFKY